MILSLSSWLAPYLDPKLQVLAILLVTVVLFLTEAVRIDLTALLVMAVLLLLGLVSPLDAVSGLSNPATVTVALMFVLSAGLTRTGALEFVGERMMRLSGGSELVLLLSLVVVVAAMSAWINNTACAAAFLPVALTLSHRSRISPSKLLIPLSYATIIGGTCTLVGTSTNILVSSMMESRGVRPFGMFEFTKLGIIMAVAAAAYLLLIGRHLLPARRKVQDLVDDFKLKRYITELVILPSSRLIGRTLQESRLATDFDIEVIEILREGTRIWLPLGDQVLLADDVLLVRGNVRTIQRIRHSEGIAVATDLKFRDRDLSSEDTVLAEAIIAPRSRLVGRTLKELNFRQRFGAITLAIQRHGVPLREKIGHLQLQVGDSLLVDARRNVLDSLRSDPDFLVIEEVRHAPGPRRRKAWVAAAILLGVILAAAFEVLPILVAAILGSILMVLLGCLTLSEAYDAVDMQVVVLLVGVLPLGLAMESTGTATWLAERVLSLLAPLGYAGIVSAFYLLGMVLTATMSNAATAALLVPLALSTATQFHADPRGLLIAITFAASADFATPIGYQTNTLVYGPGAYRFLDYTRVGLPMNLMFWLLATLLIPVFWPM